jgi:hypothetical protein
LEPKDANGNPVEAFMYNGTTYLPVRAISSAFDKSIVWDGETSGVYIGKHNGDTPATQPADTATQLMDLDYFANDRIYRSKLGVELGGDSVFDSKPYLEELLQC